MISAYRISWRESAEPPDRMTSEREFVRALQKRFSPRTPVDVGIGDDGAVLATTDAKQVVVTDMLLDGVHFEAERTTPDLIGRKAIAVNLSDLAAMGCRPTAGFISIAMPSAQDGADRFLNRLYDGIQQMCDEYQFCLAGGDTTSWAGPFAINVCLTGVPFRGDPVLRSGAQPEDLLFVTGPLGGSLSSGRHLTFQPRIEQAAWLMDRFVINAMMDLSDGLAIDLHRMMEASECGAVLAANAVPVSDDVDKSISARARLDHALSDGEDFELLFSVSAAVAQQIKALAFQSDGFRFYQVGKVTVSRDVCLNENGHMRILNEAGWQHLFQAK